MNIGELLRSARDEKGVTVTDVATATRISKKYIQALEENNFLLIPSQVYAKGFLKAYCEYLVIDAKPLLEELLVYFRGVAESRRPHKTPIRKSNLVPNIRVPKVEMPRIDVPKIVMPKFEMPKIKFPSIKLSEVKFNVNRKIVYSVLAVLVVLTLALPAEKVARHSYRFIKAHVKKQLLIKANPPSNAPVAIVKPEKKAVQQKPAAKPSTIKEKTVTVPSDKVELKIETTGRSWIQVSSGQMEIYNRTLDAGAKLNFFGRMLTVKVGNASGVKVYVNGKYMGTMGDSNIAVEKTFKAAE